MKAITVKYMPPTNTRGSRLKASAEGIKPVSIQYPYDGEDMQNAFDLAQHLADLNHWGTLHPIGGWTGKEWVFVFASRTNKPKATPQPNPVVHHQVQPWSLTGPANSVPDIQSGFHYIDIASIDAPTYIPTGSTVKNEYNDTDYVIGNIQKVR